MKVMSAISVADSSGAWHKAELTLEEEDWQEIRLSKDLPETVPMYAKFKLMESQAMVFLNDHVITTFPAEFHEQATQDRAAFLETANKMIAQLTSA